MKAKLFFTVFSIMCCVILAFPTPVQATSPDNLKIDAQMTVTGSNSAAGSFSTSELFVDNGSASEVFFIDEDTIHGVKTLVGTNGTIIIKFQATLSWTVATDGTVTGTALGRWVIISGTGAYVKLHGIGDTFATITPGNGQLVACYTGTVHFD